MPDDDGPQLREFRALFATPLPWQIGSIPSRRQTRSIRKVRAPITVRQVWQT